VGVSFVRETKVMLASEVRPTESEAALPLIERTEALLAKESPWPLWVSDGHPAYGKALFRLHSRRCRGERRPHPLLRYGQVVKVRDARNRVKGIRWRRVFGNIEKRDLSTWCIERQNLTLRHENRRLTRKTIAFSRSVKGLREQLAFYRGYYNFVRPHGSLRTASLRPGRKWEKRTPAQAAGICSRPWTLKEFLNHKVSLN